MINQIQALPLFQGKNVTFKEEELSVIAKVKGNSLEENIHFTILKRGNEVASALAIVFGCLIKVEFSDFFTNVTYDSVQLKFLTQYYEQQYDFKLQDFTEKALNDIPDKPTNITYEHFSTVMAMVDIIRNYKEENTDVE